MFNLKVESYLKFIFIISLISIISAYYIEYILGHRPCSLCLIQRIPYLLAIILTVINFLSKNNEKFILILLILVFLFSFLLSVYHYGIENGFFEESLMCSLKNSTSILSKEDLLKELNEKIVSCKDVTFRIFGFSLTTINIIISLFLTIILTKIFLNYGKFKNQN